MATLAKKAPAKAAGFDFGNLSAYSSGGGLPEGDYAIVEVSVKMYSFTKQDGSKAGEERLGAMFTFRPLAGGEDVEQFYSMGSKAHLSWEPNESGKGINPVVGGPGTAPNASTNWAAFVKSLFDSGLPVGVLSDDLGVLEGAWVHMQNVAEPEGRKGFRAASGEAAGQVEDKPRTIAVVSEIKEDGRPWEDSGGVPEVGTAAEAPTTVAKSKVAVKTALKVATKVAPAPVEAAEEEDEADIEVAAINGIAEVLGNNPNGCAKLILKTSTFKAVTQAFGDDGPAMAQKVINKYFKDDATLNTILEGLSFKVAGPLIKKA